MGRRVLPVSTNPRERTASSQNQGTSAGRQKPGHATSSVCGGGMAPFDAEPNRRQLRADTDPHFQGLQLFFLFVDSEGSPARCTPVEGLESRCEVVLCLQPHQDDNAWRKGRTVARDGLSEGQGRAGADSRQRRHGAGSCSDSELRIRRAGRGPIPARESDLYPLMHCGRR